MEDERDAENALSKLNNKSWRGTHIQVQRYEAPRSRQPERSTNIFDRLGESQEPKSFNNSGNKYGNTTSNRNNYQKEDYNYRDNKNSYDRDRRDNSYNRNYDQRRYEDRNRYFSCLVFHFVFLIL